MKAIKWVGPIFVVGVIAALLWFRGGSESRTPASATSKAVPGGAMRAQVVRDNNAGLSGRVIAASDAAGIAGATVFLNPVEKSGAVDIGGLTTVTDGDGNWSLTHLGPGAYRLSATARGFVPNSSVRVELAAKDQREGITVTLSAGGQKLTGTVSDITGGVVGRAIIRAVPVHGAFSAQSQHSYAAVATSEGAYELYLPGGRYRVTAWHDAYSPVSEHFDLVEDGTLDFALVPGATITGTVVARSSGKAIAGAEVVYTGAANQDSVGGPRGKSGRVIADKQGKFRIQGLDSGAFLLSARGNGLATRDAETVYLGIAEQAGGVELKVQDAFSISGLATIGSKTGEPAPDVVVVAAGQNGMGARSVATAADGRFTIAGLPPGKYNVYGTGAGYARSLSWQSFGHITVGNRDVGDARVVVMKGAMIRGRVDPPGYAEVGLQSVVTFADSRGSDLPKMFLSSVQTDKDGNFELGPVPPGEQELAARGVDGSRGATEVKMTTAGVDDVAISLVQKASLRGRVIDQDGEAVGDVVVSLRVQRGNRKVMMIVNGRDMTANQALTERDGDYTIRGLDAGVYDIEVRDYSGQVLALVEDTTNDVRIAENAQVADQVIRVQARKGVIRGVVTLPDGTPAADAWVRASPGEATTFGGPGGPPVPRAGKDDDAREGAAPGDDAAPKGHSTTVMMVVEQDDKGGRPGHAGFGGGLSTGSTKPVLTDSDGRFEIRGLASGRYRVLAQGIRGAARATTSGIEPGESVALKLVSLLQIEGRAMLDGRPVQQFSVETTGPILRRKTVWNEDGRFFIRRLDPGKYQVTVKSGGAEGQATVEVSSGKNASIDVELSSLFTITGRIVDADGNPVVGAMMLVGQGKRGSMSMSVTSDEGPVVTDADGRFTLTTPGGSIVVLALQDGRPVVKHWLEASGDVDVGELSTSPASQPTSEP